MWQVRNQEFAALDPARLSAELGLSRNRLQELADQSFDLYHEISIPKKAGGARRLLIPQQELKLLQRRLQDYLSRLLIAPAEVMAGIRGRDFVGHAARHRDQAYLLTMDIRAFYDSVSPPLVARALNSLGFMTCTQSLVIKLCMRDGCLPQGAPSSGLLANLSLMELDQTLLRLARRRQLNYSRYLDDLAFSGARDFKELKGPISQAIRHQGFMVAEDKTAYMGRHQPQVVTGLVVNDQLRPTRRFYDELSQEMRVLRGRRLTERHRRSLGGRLNHLARFDQPAADRLKRRFDWETLAAPRCRPPATLPPDC